MPNPTSTAGVCPVHPWRTVPAPSNPPISWRGRAVGKLCGLIRLPLDLIMRLVAWAKHYFFPSPPPVTPPAPSATTPLNFAHWRTMRTQFINKVAVAGQLPSQPNTPFDPAVAQLQTFMTQLISGISISVYNHWVKAEISTLATNLNAIPQQVQSWETLSATIAGKIVAELESSLENSAGTASTDLKAFFEWLIPDDVKAALETALDKTTDSSVVQKFLGWISSWKQSTDSIPPPPTDIPNPFDLLKSSLTTFINNKITAFFQEAADKLQNQLEPALAQSVQANAQIIGSALATRFATLVQAACDTSQGASVYQKGYDNILKILVDQTKAQLISGNGNDATARDKAFGQLSACDPMVQAMINPRNGQTADAVESKLANDDADTLMSLLLPDEITTLASGVTVKTSGLIVLLRQLQIPQAFTDALNTLLPSSMGGVGTVTHFIYYFLEQSVASMVSDQIRHGLGQGLKLGMDVVVPPGFLKMWMVKAFPALSRALVNGLANSFFATPSDSMIDTFKSLEKKKKDQATTISDLAKILYSKVEDKCKHDKVDLSAAGISQDTFIAAITPYLQAMTDSFIQKTAKGSIHITSFLQDFAKPVNAGNNSDYNYLMQAVLFQIAKFKILNSKKMSQILYEAYLSDLVSRSLTSALAPLRDSEQLILGGIVTGINTALSTQGDVDNLLFGPSLQQVDVSVEFDKQINNLAALTHIFLKQLVGQLKYDTSWYSKFFKESEVDTIEDQLPSTKDLAKGYANVYNFYLGGLWQNMNLYVKIRSVVLQSLKDISLLQ